MPIQKIETRPCTCPICKTPDVGEESLCLGRWVQSHCDDCEAEENVKRIRSEERTTKEKRIKLFQQTLTPQNYIDVLMKNKFEIRTGQKAALDLIKSYSAPDHLIFTGSNNVGKSMLLACAAMQFSRVPIKSRWVTEAGILNATFNGTINMMMEGVKVFLLDELGVKNYHDEKIGAALEDFINEIYNREIGLIASTNFPELPKEDCSTIRERLDRRSWHRLTRENRCVQFVEIKAEV